MLCHGNKAACVDIAGNALNLRFSALVVRQTVHLPVVPVGAGARDVSACGDRLGTRRAALALLPGQAICCRGQGAKEGYRALSSVLLHCQQGTWLGEAAHVLWRGWPVT